MRWRKSRYHMLICSLPALPARFDDERLPISHERLKERLRMLEPEDAEEIKALFDIMVWNERFAETTDAAVAERYTALMNRITYPAVREVAAAVIDARMIVTALRRRRSGLGPPTVGIGRWTSHIRRNFDDPEFRLAHLFPRLRKLRPMLEARDALGFQRALLEATWDQLRRRADEHHFSFEAVVLYVARWGVMRQWQQLEAGRGRAIFEALVAEALGRYADIDGGSSGGGDHGEHRQHRERRPDDEELHRPGALG